MVNNREYIISESNYGKPSITRFEDCEQYEFTKLTLEIQNILRNCIDYNTKTLNRRNITIKVLPKEFEITELKKEIKDLVGNIVIADTKVRNVYNPQNVKLDVKGISVKEAPIQITPEPPIKTLPIELPIIETPIKVIPLPEPIDEPIKEVIPTPSYGGGGGGGGFTEVERGDSRIGRDRIYEGGRENIQ